MDVYGLTGGIGSGKSTVADLLEEYGVPVVSADELSRVVVARGSEGLQAVVAKFGSEVVNASGDLDRRRMASIVFGDADRRRELEAILHPRIRDRFEQVLDALEKAGHDVCVYEVPLLFERNLQGEMKAVLLVTAPIEDRVARVRARDNVTETEVRARIAAQMDEETKRRKADYIVENTGSLDDLRREVEFLLARFLRVGHTARRPASQVDTGSNPTLVPDTQPPLRGAASPTHAAPPAAPPPRSADDPPSRRPTAVPTDAPPTSSAPNQQRDLLDEEPPPGPPTIQDTGPPPRAMPDTIHPVGPPPTPVAPPPPATAEQEGKPEHERITRIDVGPPSKKS